MKDFVHNLKQKPEHVRKRIVLGTTSAVTALVAIVWVGTMAATGAFSLAAGGTVAQAQPKALPSSNTSNYSQLAGAVAAVTGATTSAPALTIVDGKSTSTIDPKPVAPQNSATVLSF
ncbi:MAG: hypothetical protein ABIT47_01195 [Candidatus Paceibacterota bacterium]